MHLHLQDQMARHHGPALDDGGENEEEQEEIDEGEERDEAGEEGEEMNGEGKSEGGGEKEGELWTKEEHDRFYADICNYKFPNDFRPECEYTGYIA